MNKMDFTEESVSNLDEMWSLYHKFQKPNDPWIFRGQPNSKDQPRPSLERLAEKFSISFGTLPELESALLRHFNRQAHLYVANLPKDEDTIEWLALMRHYGAPTRLLDWTFSFFVGLFFGVRNSKRRICRVGLGLSLVKGSSYAGFSNRSRRPSVKRPALEIWRIFYSGLL